MFVQTFPILGIETAQLTLVGAVTWHLLLIHAGESSHTLDAIMLCGHGQHIGDRDQWWGQVMVHAVVQYRPVHGRNHRPVHRQAPYGAILLRRHHRRLHIQAFERPRAARLARRTSSLDHHLGLRFRVVDGQAAVAVEYSSRFVVVFTEVELQTVAVFGGVRAVGTAVLIDIGVRLHVRIEHALVDARIVAFRAFERLRAEMIAQVIFQMVLVLGDERTFGALQDLVLLDVDASVHPKLNLKR